MKAKLINSMHLEGLLYEHDLKLKVTGEKSKAPGTEYISGTIGIATDAECLNVVPVSYSYVTATTKAGGENKTFTLLKNIIDKKVNTVIDNGKDNAALVRVDTSIGLNEFYSNRQGQEEFVSVKRNEGGFLHIADFIAEDEKLRNRFNCDMVITNARHIDADEEKNQPEKVIIKGAIFSFNKALLPVEFTVLKPDGISYFLNAEVSASNPLFTKVSGTQISQTIVKRIEEPSAFGDPIIREVRNSRKDYIVDGCNPEPYEWGLEETMTNEELAKAIADRETYLATLKQRNDEWKQQKASTVAAPAAGGFQF